MCFGQFFLCSQSGNHPYEDLAKFKFHFIFVASYYNQIFIFLIAQNEKRNEKRNHWNLVSNQCLTLCCANI
jgi:hypothetical protein